MILSIAPSSGMATSSSPSSESDATSAAEAAKKLFERFDRESSCDPFSELGATLPAVKGHLQFTGVAFSYPTAEQFKICTGLTLEVQPGQVCALCGPSGSGKSTVIALLQRFYDPTSGSVLLDGVELKTLNLKWLRRQMGLVGQEPVLFEGTVAENIGYGKEGATQAEIEEAAEAANAHQFITSDLGAGYGTQVGLRGGKLSGGQKQRIAIARAIIKKPSIMLLDEATSALDNASEKVVQAALDGIMKQGNFTSITIAHRLSTIMRSDKIAVVQKGAIVEQGTYDELLAIGEGGVFYKLAAKQQAHRESDAETMAEAEAEAAAEAGAGGKGEAEAEVGSGDKKGSRGKEASGDKKDKKDKGKGEKEPKEKEKDPMGRLFSYITPGDGPLYFFGVLSGGLTGVARGFFGLLMMRSITALAPSNPNTLYEGGLVWSLVFLAVGVAVLVLNTVSWSCLTIAGEHLTTNLRLALLTKLLHNEVGYFDHEDNSMGALTEFLGEKVTLLQGLVGEKLGMIAQAVVMLVTTVVTMFVWGDWRVSLVVLGCMPISGVLMSVAMAAMMPIPDQKQDDKDAKQNKSAGSVVGEVVLSIRTVASFNAEQQFFDDYSAQVDASSRRVCRAPSPAARPTAWPWASCT